MPLLPIYSYLRASYAKIVLPQEAYYMPMLVYASYYNIEKETTKMNEAIILQN